MFRCGFCKKTSQLGEKKTMIPTETREKNYPRREERHGFFTDLIDRGGAGREIVKETAACEKCVEEQRKAA